MGNLFGSIVANGIGAVDALTPGRLGQTLNNNIRDPNADIYGTTRNGAIMTPQEIAAQKAADAAAQSRLATAPAGQVADDSGQYLGAYTSLAQEQAARQAAADAAAYDASQNNLNDLLGRTDTGLNQGLESLNSSYQDSLTQQENAKAQALQDYSDKRVATNKDKLGAYNTINKNGNNGYRSLAQIIGRSAGTGSSAFQEALPDAVGKDMSSKRTDANNTYATNMGGIDNAQKKTELSFENVLADLANQKRSQEQQLRTGVEQQKQNLLGQQQQLQASRGNSAGVNALQGQISNSRNAVESFFNQFKPTMQAQQAAIAAPDLSAYQVDRSNVNAQQQGVSDPTNPYADILRKKLQEQSAV